MARTMVRSKSVVAAAVLAGAVVVGVAGLAFACTPGGEVYISPPSGLAGSQPTLSGNNWGAHEAQLEIRWNSMSGPVLAKVTPVGGSFSVAVTIPQATPGVYYIVAKSPTRATPARVAFEITAPRTANAPAQSPETQTSADADAGESAASSGSGQTAASTSGGDASATSSAPASGSFGPVAGSGAPSANAEAAPTATEAAASPSASSAGSTNAARPDPVANDARTPAAAAPPAPSGASTPALLSNDDQPSERTASGDLASAFEAGPSLVPSLDDSSTPAAPGSPLALGAGLLAAGLGTLFAGFAAAELRRRRSVAA